MTTEGATETETTEDEEAKRKRGRSGDEDGLRADLAAERKSRQAAQKAVKELETRLKELEDRDKSDAEKAGDRTAAAEARADKAEAEAAKLRVGLEKGLTLRQAMRLQGTTEEELTADADDLMETFPGKGKASETDGEADKGDQGQQGQGRPPSRRPTADLRGGGDPTTPPEDMDPAKLAEFIPRP